MADGSSSLVRFVVLGLCLGVTALGFVNTYGDNADVIQKAQAKTCTAGDCSYQMLRQQRSPFSQSFTFQVSTTKQGRSRSASADVECARPYVLLGEYDCQVTSGGFESMAAAPAGS